MEITIYYDSIEKNKLLAYKQAGKSPGRCLLQSVMEREYGWKKDSYKLKENSYGKPYIEGTPEITFSIADTKQLVMVAVAQGGQEIGLDAEWMRCIPEALQRRFFHKEELAWIHACESVEAQNKRALAIWTRKEAYGKWTGKGIAFDMGNTSTVSMPISHMLETRWEENWVWSLCADTPFTVKLKQWTYLNI